MILVQQTSTNRNVCIWARVTADLLALTVVMQQPTNRNSSVESITARVTADWLALTVVMRHPTNRNLGGRVFV